MFRLIVVPLDGTRFAEHGVRPAMALAAATGCRLLLAHVDVAPLPMDEPHTVNLHDIMPPGAYETGIIDYLTVVVDRIVASLNVDAEYTILTGAVAQAVERLATDRGADLIVMASHDLSALGRLAAGSVGERLVRESGLPVLLVRKSDEQLRMERDADPASASDPITGHPIIFRHVVVPLDGAPLGEAVLEPASRLFKQPGRNKKPAPGH
jgi:nucleotide-binding universal stress UspA family protein